MSRAKLDKTARAWQHPWRYHPWLLSRITSNASSSRQSSLSLASNSGNISLSKGSRPHGHLCLKWKISKYKKRKENSDCRLIGEHVPLLQLLLKASQDKKFVCEGLRNLYESWLSQSAMTWLSSAEAAHSSEEMRFNLVYQVGEIFELGIQLSYLLLHEKIRSGDASATEIFELGAVMLRKKFYPAQQAISKWDGDDQDLAQVFTILLVLATSVMRSSRRESINLKDLKAALKAFEEVLLFDPNKKLALRRRDALNKRVQMYKGIPMKSSKAEKSLPPWNVNLFAQKQLHQGNLDSCLVVN
ncbi:hypothetical protein MKW92_004310 [Papaver armeniacum]|nr:hypothetical protein MKW92_004310 [Papaver armeniacum]